MSTDGTEYLSASREAAREFDSRVFWLAGSAIALSLTFYQSLVKTSPVVGTGWLMLGWTLLIAAIAVVMTSFQLSVMACNCYFEATQPDAGEDVLDRGGRYSRWVEHLNWFALAAVVSGILLVCVFFFLNADLDVRKEQVDATPAESREYPSADYFTEATAATASAAATATPAATATAPGE